MFPSFPAPTTSDTGPPPCPLSSGGSSIDPKPGNETGRKLSLVAGCGPLDESRRRTNAEEGTQRREDHLRLAASRGGQEGGRDLPGDGRLPAGVLQLEAKI